MAAVSLDALPDDIILDVLTHISTASSVANLSKTSRRAHHIIQQNGWRTWSRHSFPNLTLPASNKNWNAVADRLTYLDRCWEKRGFLLHGFQEADAVKPKQQRRQGRAGRQTVGFYPVLDARLLESGGDELLVWGAGENLVTRTRPTDGSKGKKDQWNTLKGSEAGYSAGFGDVTAVSIVERDVTPEVLVGRANGELKLVQATGDSLGSPTQTLLPEEPQLNQESGSSGTSTPRRSPGQQAISWTEWQPQSNLVASCKNSTISLFDLTKSETSELKPLTIHDMTEDRPDDELALIRGAKFMDKDTIVCALGNSRQPIRWSKITPTGLEFMEVANNPGPLEWVAAQSETDIDVKTTVRAIESVGPSGNLLLSAWDDGTYRMMDIRTPSPHEAVYRDRWYTYDAASTLLVYGNQRFVAGGKTASKLHFYDFRYPKAYHHTDALSCSPELPQPDPPFLNGSLTGSSRGSCNESQGTRCERHRWSRSDPYRPDATFHIGDSTHDRVHALAKSSDLSSSFYCGLQGAVTEVQLKLAEDVTTDDYNRPAPSGWRNMDRKAPLIRDVALMENGTSLCRQGEWQLQETGFAGMWRQSRFKTAPGMETLAHNKRLDSAYYMPRR